MLPPIPPKMLRRSVFLSTWSILFFLLCRLRTLPVSVAVPAADALFAPSDLADLADAGDAATSFSTLLSSERPKNCRRLLFSFGAVSPYDIW
jgi:hypothetical protein